MEGERYSACWDTCVWEKGSDFVPLGSGVKVLLMTGPAHEDSDPHVQILGNYVEFGRVWMCLVVREHVRKTDVYERIGVLQLYPDSTNATVERRVKSTAGDASKDFDEGKYRDQWSENDSKHGWELDESETAEMYRRYQIRKEANKATIQSFLSQPENQFTLT